MAGDDPLLVPDVPSTNVPVSGCSCGDCQAARGHGPTASTMESVTDLLRSLRHRRWTGKVTMRFAADGQVWIELSEPMGVAGAHADYAGS